MCAVCAIVEVSSATGLGLDGDSPDGPGSPSQVSVCGKAAALSRELRLCPRGSASAAPRWRRSGCWETLRSNAPPLDGQSPWGLSAAPGFLRREKKLPTF